MLLAAIAWPAAAQFTTILDSSGTKRTVIPGKEYEASALKKFLFGSNWRREWTTAVVVPVLHMDTLGGLTPIELGGGRQTKTLHVKDAQGKRYVLRSVNKTYTLALPEIARGTVAETVMNDQISTNHPYAAFAIPPMASAAGVYHTNPKLYLLAPHERLGTYNEIFGNMLVLFEERPDKSHAKTPHFGNADDIDGSETMVENLTEDNDVQMDQHHYLKTRLFDIFIGDWGRHIDNWRWAEFDSGKKEIYRPVPKDRDQTWARFEGIMMKVAKMIGGLKQLQSFGGKIKNLEWYNYPAVDIDRRFTNALTRRTWIDTATALQQYLTDAVIENAVRQMPPEAFAISGQKIIKHLKQRRNDLVKYADEYYTLLSHKVDIPGSNKHELFKITRINDNETSVQIYKINKEREQEAQPFYSRIFFTNETEEVRLYALDGNDVFDLKGETNEGITIRIIAGRGNDSLHDVSKVNGGTHKTRFYDTTGTDITASDETKIRLADTTYQYPFTEKFHFDHDGYSFRPGLHPFYRLYVGAGYQIKNYGWREKPFKSEFRFGVNFSLSEKTLHPYFTALHPQIFGAWNLQYAAGYDGSRRFHYMGTGNESQKNTDFNDFYFLRTENLYTSTGLDINFSDHHNFGFHIGYDGVKVRSGDGYVSKTNNVVDLSTFSWKHFGTTGVTYSYNRINDPVVPTSGLQFTSGISYTGNFNEPKSFVRYHAGAGMYIPLISNFSLFINTGAATLKGEPEFYQLNQIGGNITVRGYLRNRFYGQTAFYDQNELRWIPDFKSYLFNGKIGLIALFDMGRVWQPGEQSGKWHYGYGGGVMIVPFNKFSATVYYSVSPEDRLANLRLGKFF